ncbi:MAG: glycosyltransferase [Planctomycetes bacterium]|nr:glycosyltransferase [Planctomycetota bacterium]
MKIAIVLHQFLPRYTTGTELYVCALAERLRARDVVVEVFTGEDDGRSLLAAQRYTHAGLEVHRFTHHRSLEPEPIRATYDSPLAAAAFGRFLERFQPDVVHVFHLLGLGGGVLDAAYRREIPYVVHLMDYWLLCPRTQMLDFEGALCSGPRDPARCARCAGEVDGSFQHLAAALAAGDPPAGGCAPDLEQVAARWPFLQERLLRAARLVSPSRYLRDRFADNGVDPARIEVLPYGVDVSSMAPEARPREPERVRFGYLGNLATFKGAHLALQAFTRLEGPDLRLAVYGDFFFREAAQIAACRALVERDPRIEMNGPFPHPEIGPILASLDAVIVPSLWHENTPFVVLEARRAGVPVIGSRVGGIEEVLEDGVDGLLFQRGNVEDLARQMARFAAGEVQLAVRADALPTLDANADALLACYRELAAARVPPDPAVVAGIDAALHENLFRVVEGLAARLDRLGARGGSDREIVAAIDQAARLTSELEGHRRALAEQTAIHRRLREDVAAMEARHGEELARHRQALRTLEADLAAHREALAEREADLAGHRQALAEREADLAGHRQVAAELRRDLAGHRAVLAQREAEARGLGQALENVRADLEGHRRALALAREEAERWRALETDWREKARALEELRVAHAAAAAAAREQAARLASLESELAVLRDEVDSTAQGKNL